MKGTRYNEQMASEIHMRLTLYNRSVRGKGMTPLESAEDDGLRGGG